MQTLPASAPEAAVGALAICVGGSSAIDTDHDVIAIRSDRPTELHLRSAGRPAWGLAAD